MCLSPKKENRKQSPKQKNISPQVKPFPKNKAKKEEQNKNNINDTNLNDSIKEKEINDSSEINNGEAKKRRKKIRKSCWYSFIHEEKKRTKDRKEKRKYC